MSNSLLLISLPLKEMSPKTSTPTLKANSVVRKLLISSPTSMSKKVSILICIFIFVC